MKTCLAASVALVVAAVLACTSMAARAQTPNRPAPTVRPAIDGILAAFEKHPLVGLGDIHNMAQQEDFFVTLIRDPRFAKEVGNVVVEFGASTHQDILDRYPGVAGRARDRLVQGQNAGRFQSRHVAAR